MNSPSATSSSPSADGRRSRNLTVLGVTGGALLATMWTLGQSGVSPTQPASFAAHLALLIESLPTLAAVWLGAAGLGYPLQRALARQTHHRILVQLALGMAALLIVNWLLAWAGALGMATAWGLCLIGAALLVVQAARAQRADASEPITLNWALPLAALGAGIALVAAACPPGTLWRVEAMGYDVLSYHLQLPAEWLEAGAMTGLEHNVYSHFPSLIEAGYMMLGAMHGSMHDAIYLSQLFHASLALLAAAAVGGAVSRHAGATAGALAGATLLALPWVIITGSLAYNEMAVLAFGGAALLVMLQPNMQRSWRGPAVVGALLGAATLAKLTAGLMLAVPVGIVALLGWHRGHREANADAPRDWRANVRFAAVMALAGSLVLAPHLVRNATWTGNPVFPFATSVLGSAHWDEAHAQRWHAGHSPDWAEGGRLAALTQQWLLNTGYGALGGYETERTAADVARFDREGGVPVLWLAVAASAASMLRRREQRPLALAMSALIALQVVVWLGFTHMQSRFMLPTLLPATLLLGLGLGELRALGGSAARLMPVIGGALVVALAGSSALVLHEQTRAVPGADGMMRPAPPALLVDSLAAPDGQMPGWPGDHAINALEPTTKTYLVADNQSLLYIRRPIVYHTPFDPSPLGEMIRAADGEPGEVNRRLRDRGITHVWINWSELERLHATYGYDAAVTRDALEALIDSGWRRVQQHGDIAALYALP